MIDGNIPRYWKAWQLKSGPSLSIPEQDSTSKMEPAKLYREISVPGRVVMILATIYAVPPKVLTLRICLTSGGDLSKVLYLTWDLPDNAKLRDARTS